MSGPSLPLCHDRTILYSNFITRWLLVFWWWQQSLCLLMTTLIHPDPLYNAFLTRALASQTQLSTDIVGSWALLLYPNISKGPKEKISYIMESVNWFFLLSSIYLLHHKGTFYVFEYQLKRSNNCLHFFDVMQGKIFGLLFFSLTSDWLWICVSFFLVPGAHREEDERVYHAYYQWVPIVLTLQAIAFYAPHWIWKQLEGGRLTKIVCGLDQKINDDGDRTQKVTQLRFEKLSEFDIFLPKIY